MNPEEKAIEIIQLTKEQKNQIYNLSLITFDSWPGTLCNIINTFGYQLNFWPETYSYTDMNLSLPEFAKFQPARFRFNWFDTNEERRKCLTDLIELTK